MTTPPRGRATAALRSSRNLAEARKGSSANEGAGEGLRRRRPPASRVRDGPPTAIVAELGGRPIPSVRFIRQQAERIPDRVALKFEDETVTYGAYDAQVNRLAARPGARRAARRGRRSPSSVRNSPALPRSRSARSRSSGAIGALINTHVDRRRAHPRAARVRARASASATRRALARAGRRRRQPPVRFLRRRAAATRRCRRASRRSTTCCPASRPSPTSPTSAAATCSSTSTPRARPATRSPRSSGTCASRMGGISLAQMLGIEDGRDDLRAAAALPRREPLRRLRARVPRRRRLRLAPAVLSASAFLDDVRRHEAVAFVYVGELCRYLLRQPPSPHDRDHRLRVAAGAGLRPDVWTRVPGALRHPAHRRDVRRHRGQRRAPEPRRPRRLGRQAARACSRTRSRWCASTTPRGDIVRGADGFCLPCDADEPGELLGQVGAARRHGVRRLHRPRGHRAQAPARRLRSPATRGSAAATCSAATPRATTTSSTASATRSAGRARTSPRRRWPTS